jgi:hypothetical protein
MTSSTSLLPDAWLPNERLEGDEPAVALDAPFHDHLKHNCFKAS